MNDTSGAAGGSLAVKSHNPWERPDDTVGVRLPAWLAKVVFAGVVPGLVAALASTRQLDVPLYHVNALDPVVFIAMSIMMVGIGLLACYVPARRPSSVEAIESLRPD